MSALHDLIIALQHSNVQQLALQRHRYPDLSDADFRFLLQQIEGRQRTAHKLPFFATIPDWWYPVRLSCEQCSSEATARYKSQLISKINPHTLVDLTGGYGVDTFFMSEQVDQVHYVEQNEELCRIAQHNFSLTRPHISVHHDTAQSFLSQSPLASCPSPISSTLLYLDPARRDAAGGKVFRIEDCEPNVVELLPTLRALASHIMIKFSPMLDISAALRSLPGDWDVHIVAVGNEVKEVLLITGTGRFHAVNIVGTTPQSFSFHVEEERSAQPVMATQMGRYLYEPNAAIIKAGAYRLISASMQLAKLAANTHLYTSDTLLADFPGRVWEVVETPVKEPKKLPLAYPNAHFSIISRNYPMTPEQLRKKYRLPDGDDYYLIAARLANHPLLLLCQRTR